MIENLNTELLEELACQIEVKDDGVALNKHAMFDLGIRNPRTNVFSMQDANHGCGSPACIAGHVYASSAHEGKLNNLVSAAETIARGSTTYLLAESHLLPVLPYWASTLFTPMVGGWHYAASPGEPGHITAKHAAACLRLLARTGKVDWDKAVSEIVE